jgi:hypothetical protein
MDMMDAMDKIVRLVASRLGEEWMNGGSHNGGGG